MGLYHLASKAFLINKDDVSPMNLQEKAVWFKIMPFQQVAWYFKGIDGYIIVSETQWNLLLYYITDRGPYSYLRVVPTRRDTELILEAIIDSNSIPKENNCRDDISLICFLFLQNESKIDLVVECEKSSRKMQTTIHWKGMYLDLMTSRVYFDKHRYVDPYQPEVESKGFVTIYNDHIGKERDCCFVMESDQRLRRWKDMDETLTIVSSKKRNFVPAGDEPIGCHHMKVAFLENRVFDTVYIMQHCFDTMKCIPRARRYVICIDSIKDMQSRYFDVNKLKLLGISDNVISSVRRDSTGILMNFLFASCFTSGCEKSIDIQKEPECVL